MTTTLRHMGKGARFMLCRTGEKFIVAQHQLVTNWQHVRCVSERNGELHELNHQCYVKPIVRIANARPL